MAENPDGTHGPTHVTDEGIELNPENAEHEIRIVPTDYSRFIVRCDTCNKRLGSGRSYQEAYGIAALHERGEDVDVI